MRGANLIVLIFTLFFSFCSGPQRQENAVRIRASQDPENLNPVNYPNVTALEIINLVYQSLLAPDPETKEIYPLLAERLPVVQKEDSISVFNFKLKEEARWPNNQPITAADVAFSLKLYRCPLIDNGRIAGRYYFIKDIISDKVKPSEFKLICEKYNPDMDLMTGDFAVLPEYIMDPKGLLKEFSLAELTQQYDSLSTHPKIKEFAAWFNSDRFSRDKDFLQGSGGYELDTWKTGEYIKLKKKQNWWGEGLSKATPYLAANPDKITFRIIPDNAMALRALKQQEIDVFAGIPADIYQQLNADKAFREKFNLFSPESYNITYLGINGRLAKFADARTRQALAYLLNKDQLINGIQNGFATPTVGLIAPAEKRFYNSAIKPYAFDLNKATALLQQAGWVKKGDGWQKQINGQWVPLTINLNYKAGNTEFENIALVFQEAAAKINIPVTIQPMEGILLTNNLNTHNFELFIRYLVGNPFVTNFREILHTESAAEGGANYTGFGTPESDKLIEQINQTSDEYQKGRYLKRFQEILHEQSNVIPLYFSKERIAVNKRFTNLKISGLKPGYDVSAFTVKAQ
jgi:peptide/nickel transport system substrate-binding protein